MSNRELNRSDRDFRARGILERREHTVAFKWEEERKSTLLGWGRETAFFVHGVDVISWTLTNKAIVLIPFSASVVGCEPSVMRFPFGAGYRFVSEYIRRPFDPEAVEYTSYLSAWRRGRFIYRGEFASVDRFRSTNFFSALREGAGENYELATTTLESEGELASTRLTLDSSSLGMKLIYSLLPVSGGYCWVVDFTSPVRRSDLPQEAMTEIRATANRLSDERDLGDLIVSLRQVTDL